MTDLIDRTWFWCKYDMRAFWRYGLWAWIAGKLPHRLVYAVVIRAWSKSCPGDAHPDTVTAPQIADFWKTND